MIREEKLTRVMDYIRKFQEENGYTPSVREIGQECNIKSTATVHTYLERLREKGYLTKTDHKKRSVTVGKGSGVSIPLIGTVTAGTPILAVENLEGYYPLPYDYKSDSELFMLRVRGESMINAGILDGDKIIVKKQETAENGDIVVALFDDEATVKRFYKKDGKLIFHPENDTMSDIIVEDANILGIVVGLMRKF